MHLLVINIPEEFRTPDLRNFFSDIVEKDVFNCFHFRHRPFKNFVSLLHDRNQKNQINTLSGTKCEFCGGHVNENRDILKAQESSNHPEVSCGPWGELGEDREGHRPSEDKAVLSSRPSVSEEIGISRSNECVCQRKTSLSKEQNETDEDDVSQTRSKVGSHWLSSGLSGLTSLIKEKKQKASKENTLGLVQNKTFRPTTTGSKGDSLQSTANNCTTEIRPNINFNSLTLSDYESRVHSADVTCCVLDIKENYAEKFLSLYHGKYWVDRKGDILPQKCFIVNLNLDKPSASNDITGSDTEENYLTRGDMKFQHPSLMDMKNMIEFRPPSVMPQGNVGTPTLYFKNLIRTCQLPGTIITKLGLQFPRSSRGKKRFGQVPFDYGTRVYSGSLDNQEGFIAFTATGHLIPASVDPTRLASKKKKLRKSEPRVELENEAEDGAEVEEWERYEAFHNDVTTQDRTKERLYEKEIELVWEKGGPGLVFYTDAQYWREQEGDFDEQTADEWDVDMSVYYEKEAGDKDALDSVGMLDSNDLRSGALTQSAFKSANKRIDGSQWDKRREKDSSKRRKIGPAAPPKIGDFETHTRGFGRRLMESQGWTDGFGLGRQKDGLPYALGNDGQHPHDKKGLGFHGEKFEGWGKSSTSSRQHQHSSMEEDSDSKIRISTVFDHRRDLEPPVPHLRTSEPTRLSHRHNRTVFCKPSKSNML